LRVVTTLYVSFESIGWLPTQFALEMAAYRISERASAIINVRKITNTLRIK